MSKKQKLSEGRRNFLRSSAAVGATAVAASALSGQAVAAIADEEVKQPVNEGYRMTDHIAAYYKAAAY